MRGKIINCHLSFVFLYLCISKFFRISEFLRTRIFSLLTPQLLRNLSAFFAFPSTAEQLSWVCNIGLLIWIDVVKQTLSGVFIWFSSQSCRNSLLLFTWFDYAMVQVTEALCCKPESHSFRSLLRYLGFFIELVLPAALWLWGWLSLTGSVSWRLQVAGV